MAASVAAKQLRRYPAVPADSTSSYPHVVHNRWVVKIAAALADITREIHGITLNRDYLLAAALLMDGSKLVKYEVSDGNIQRSPIGQQLPHGTYGAHVALEVGLPMEIVHMILAHTPESTVPPQTKKGKALLFLDQVDMAVLGTDRWQRKLAHFR